MTDRVEKAITTLLIVQPDTRARRAARWLWKPWPLVALALASGVLGAAMLRSAADRQPAERPTAREQTAAEPASHQIMRAREAARRVETLAAALTSPHHLMSGALGPHRVRDRAELTAQGGSVPSIAIATEIAYAAPDSWKARAESSAGTSREVVTTGGMLYTRAGYGPYHRRPPEHRHEARELAGEWSSTPGTYVSALLPGAAIRATRDVTRGGRRALAIELHTGREGAATDATARLADGATVSRVRGTIVLDAETRALLEADIRGALAIRQDGRRVHVELEVSRELVSLGAPLAIEAPTDDDVIALIGQNGRDRAGAKAPAEAEP